MPPSYIRVHAVVWAYGRGQTDTHTDTQTRVTTIHFALALCCQNASPGRLSNVENAPLVDGQTPASQPHPLAIYGAQF